MSAQKMYEVKIYICLSSITSTTNGHLISVSNNYLNVVSRSVFLDIYFCGFLHSARNATLRAPRNVCFSVHAAN